MLNTRIGMIKDSIRELRDTRADLIHEAKGILSKSDIATIRTINRMVRDLQGSALKLKESANV